MENDNYSILSNGLVGNYLVKHNGKIAVTGLTLTGAEDWILRQKQNKLRAALVSTSKPPLSAIAHLPQQTVLPETKIKPEERFCKKIHQ